MSEDVLLKYAPTLTAEDLLYLLSKLVRKYGSKARAARECGINRRSYYMLQRRNFIEPETKEKILLTTYKSNPEETLEYVLKRHANESLEMLLINLSKLYEDAIDEVDRLKLRDILIKYDHIKNEYEGWIASKIQKEVLDQTINLKQKAILTEVTWNPSKATLFKVQELKSAIPLIMRELSIGKNTEEISEKLDISKDLIEVFSNCKQEEITNIYDFEGFTYRRIKNDPYNFWLKEIQTAAGSVTPQYRTIRRPYENVESQTSTAQATGFPDQLER